MVYEVLDAHSVIDHYLKHGKFIIFVLHHDEIFETGLYSYKQIANILRDGGRFLALTNKMDEDAFFYKGYEFIIQESSIGGWDYTIYRGEQEVDGGVYDDPDASLQDVFNEIIADVDVRCMALCG